MSMKNLMKKLNSMSNQGEVTEESSVSRRKKMNLDSSSPRSQNHSEHNKTFSALTGWFHSVTNKKSPNCSPSSSNSKKEERIERSESASSGGFEAAVFDVVGCDSEASISKDVGINEEYQIQMAMELSAKEDPEAVQIEAAKKISLGSYALENDPAEIFAYRYWNCNALTYDDKILDGFYDVYGVITESTSSKMPSLVDLQGMSASEGISWEVILVNKCVDVNLSKLEKRAIVLANIARSKSLLSVSIELVEEVARLVANNMGGPVADPGSMLRAWNSLSYSLKSTLGSLVMPLGSLTMGLARHRALLFKVLADSVGIPCQLVKGQRYTGSDEVAMNIVKVDDGREFIVDLMADPGTLIPFDGLGTHVEYEEYLSSCSPLSRDVDSSTLGPSSSGAIISFEESSAFETMHYKSKLKRQPGAGSEPGDDGQPVLVSSLHRPDGGHGDRKTDLLSDIPPKVERLRVQEFPAKASYPLSHIRSPSWTEGISPPAMQHMKVKDVSQIVIDAAIGNPQFAQKLHDALVESGVVTPPNFLAGLNSAPSDALAEAKRHLEDKEKNRYKNESKVSEHQVEMSHPYFLPPLPHRGADRTTSSLQQEYHKSTESSDVSGEASGNSLSSPSDVIPVKSWENAPVAATAAAAAAVVASSVVAAIAKSSADSNIELPVAAAAAIIVTTAAVGNQYEHLDSPNSVARFYNQIDGIRIRIRSDGDADSVGHEPQRSDQRKSDGLGENLESERTSDRSTGTDSGKSEVPFTDVADCEIPWEEITLGERIGLGSYGEVYHGDWHGTEVAVKKFLDQHISGESLEEFKSEVLLMKKLRHPNIVLFMGAVTRPPNLSIVAEFLPRGSLYRLLHRPNNQLDERRRLRMAFDAARGMNYLHNCSPVIVHRDLKSPNLVVDRNWVVKVCDFGLSRMKYSTFLSSRSMAGTGNALYTKPSLIVDLEPKLGIVATLAEWMAPEVLRNEPSNEKCDVYSFGVILWELLTLKQPWGGMNPMQVVGAVGFQHRRLDIPDDIDPVVAEIIRKCWETDPRLRPSFAEIMAALKPFQKPVTSAQVSRHGASRGYAQLDSGQ